MSAQLPNHASEVEVGDVAPFCYLGTNLGMSTDKLLIHFSDRSGQQWVTDSVEDILARIDHFPNERDRHKLLVGVAIHYGFRDPWVLIDGREAKDTRLRDFEGQLKLLGFDLQRTGGAIYTRSHTGLHSIALEEALRRLNQYTVLDQMALLQAVAEHFNFDPLEWSTYLQGGQSMEQSETRPAMRNIGDEELVERARIAYAKSGATDQPGADSDVQDLDGTVYVVLRNVNGILAVYRFDGDRLKSLNGWPDEIV